MIYSILIGNPQKIHISVPIRLENPEDWRKWFYNDTPGRIAINRQIQREKKLCRKNDAVEARDIDSWLFSC